MFERPGRDPGSRRRVGLSALFLVLLVGSPLRGQQRAAAADEDEDLAARIDAAADSAGVPGGAVVILRGDDPAFFHPFGVADSAGTPITRTSAFRVASVSKVFTAAAVARLVAGGRLDLDADLRSGRPWLASLASDQPVTLRQLLTHTSGFDDRAVGMFARTPASVESLSDYLPAHMPRRTTRPGRWTRYSNYGAGLAGLVVAETVGSSFAAAADSLLFAPLGMASSSFAQPLPADLERRLARAFPCPDARCLPRPLDYRRMPPAGGLVTTPADMAVFLRALSRPADSALGATAVEVLTRRAWGHRPELPGLALALQEQQVAGHRAVVHAGNSSGYTSLFVVVPGADAGLFVVATGGSTRFGAHVLRLFANGLPPAADADAGAVSGSPRPVPAGEQEQYAGTYLLGRAARGSYEGFAGLFLFASPIGFDEDGWLVRVEGGELRRYGRVDGDLFETVDGVDPGRDRGRLAFEREDGEVVALHAASVFNGARFPAAYERLAGWEAPHFMNELLSWLAALPVLALVAWGLFFAASFVFRRDRRGPARGGLARVGLVVAVGLVLEILAFGFGFMAKFNAMAMDRPETLAYGLPVTLSRLLWLPWAVAAGAVLLLAVTLRAWSRRGREQVRVSDRLLFAVVASCGVALSALLVHFHLLPPAG
jgi:CubicO group peptidase (beta-lactamase class C family)